MCPVAQSAIGTICIKCSSRSHFAFSLFLSAKKALQLDKMSLFCAAMEGSIKLDARITILGINCMDERFMDGAE